MLSTLSKNTKPVLGTGREEFECFGCEPGWQGANPDSRGDASEMPRCRPPQCYLARKDPLFA